MTKYNRRVQAPSSENKYYKHYSYGGLNRCIHIKNGSCLPNCVGYAWGRWYEILGEKPKLSRSNAENWYSYTEDGYKRGKTPKLGAVICWRKGKAGNESDGAGHVAVVEKINADGSILVSESMYGGTRFYTRTLYPPEYKLNDKSYVFQGFIYLPVEFEEEAKYTTGDYRVVCEGYLHVRMEPTTNSGIVPYDLLTNNAKRQISNLGHKKVNGYPKGIECTVSKVEGIWGKTPSGWICLDYCEKI